MRYSIELIDDDPTFVQFMRDLIASHPGDNMELDSNGTLAAGMAMCQTAPHPYNLAILDLNLPDAKGLYTLETFMSRFPEIPVLVLTGHYDPAQAERALEMGAQGYFGKPLDDIDAFYESIRRGVMEAVARNKKTIGLLHRIGDLESLVSIQDQKIVEQARMQIAQEKKIEELNTAAKTRRKDVDQRFKRRDWATTGTAVMAFLAFLGKDKVAELITLTFGALLKPENKVLLFVLILILAIFAAGTSVYLIVRKRQNGNH